VITPDRLDDHAGQTRRFLYRECVGWEVFDRTLRADSFDGAVAEARFWLDRPVVTKLQTYAYIVEVTDGGERLFPLVSERVNRGVRD
jgi:hypothetical protein